jgi:hypothetical protein
MAGGGGWGSGSSIRADVVNECWSTNESPPQIATNKRYAGNSGWTVSEVAERVGKDIGNIDILVSTLLPGTVL